MNAKSASVLQEVTVENGRESATVSVTKKIDPDDVTWDHGDPTFAFRLDVDAGGGKIDQYYATARFDAGMEPGPDGMLSAEATFAGVDLGGSHGKSSRYVPDEEEGTYARVYELGSVRYGETDVEADQFQGGKDDGAASCFNVWLEGLVEPGKSVHAGAFANKKTDWTGLSDADARINVVAKERSLTALTAEWTGGAVSVGTEDASDFDATGLQATAWFDDGTSMDVVVDGTAQPGASWSFDGLDAWTDGTYALVVSYESNGVKKSATVLVELDFADPPAYALLYEDGTMVFQVGSSPDPDRGPLLQGWTDFMDTGGSAENVPWADFAYDVTSVVFEDSIAPKSTAWWFWNMRSLKEFDISLLDTSNVEDMSFMFYERRALESISLPESFDTSNVKNMTGMFKGCSSLVELELPESFDTSNVEDMGMMFENCSMLASIDLPEAFDTSNVKNMYYMFSACMSLKDTSLLERFDTSNVVSMESMFARCIALSKVSLPESFDTSKVETTAFMFNNCWSLGEISLPESFVTTSVKNMSYMFASCRSLALDASGWDVGSVTSYENFNLSSPGVIPPVFVSASSATSLTFTTATEGAEARFWRVAVAKTPGEVGLAP